MSLFPELDRRKKDELFPELGSKDDLFPEISQPKQPPHNFASMDEVRRAVQSMTPGEEFTIGGSTIARVGVNPRTGIPQAELLPGQNVQTSTPTIEEVMARHEISRGRPIQPPTVAGEFMRGLPGTLKDIGKEAGLSTAAAASYMGAGAVKGATMGYVDPTPMLEKTPLADQPISKGIAGVTGQRAGAIAPISGISKLVGAGAKAVGLSKVARPIYETLAKAASTGGVFGAARKPEDGENRADNALKDSSLFIAFVGAGEGVKRLFSKTILIPDAKKAEVTLKAAEEGVDAYTKGASAPEARRVLQAALDREAALARQQVTAGEAGTKALQAGPPEIPATEVQVPTAFGRGVQRLIERVKKPSLSNMRPTVEPITTTATGEAEGAMPIRPAPPAGPRPLAPAGALRLGPPPPRPMEPTLTPQAAAGAVQSAPIRTKEDFKRAYMTAGNRPEQEAEAFSSIADARADAWSTITGRPKTDYYETRFAGFEGEGGPSLNQLNQDLFEVQKQNVGDRYARYAEEAKRQGLNDRDSRKYALDRLNAETRRQAPEMKTPPPQQVEFGAAGGVRSFGRGAKGEAELFQPAYHGSPHTFDKFSLQKIGSGEGNQAYGWGLYFAGNKEVAEFYRKNVVDARYLDKVNEQLDKLSNEMDKYRAGEYGKFTDPKGYELKVEYDRLMDEKLGKKGRLYKVDIPEDTEYLDWDKPISQQSETVKAKLKAAGIDPMGSMLSKGSDLYSDLMRGDPRVRAAGFKHSPEGVSRFLASKGIPGIKFADQGSRGKGGGTSNYVLFDDKLIKIMELEQQKKGSVTFQEDNRAIIKAFQAADASTGIHELGHVFRRDLYRTLEEALPQYQGTIGADISTLEKWVGAKDGNWTREAEEKFARGFERYMVTGESPSKEIQVYFDMFADWIKKVYGSVKGSSIDVQFAEPVRQVFDRLFSPEVDSDVMSRARSLYKEAQANRQDAYTSLEKYVIENPIMAFKGGAESKEYADIPVRFKAKYDPDNGKYKGQPLDIVAEEAQKLNLIPKGVNAENHLYKFLTGIAKRGDLETISDYVEQAAQQLAEERTAGPLPDLPEVGEPLYQEEPTRRQSHLFPGMERYAEPAENRTKVIAPKMKEALLGENDVFKDLSLGEAGELSTLAPIRASEKMDGKRFGMFKQAFLFPIQDADRDFQIELKRKVEAAKDAFKGLSREDRELVFNVIEKKETTVNPRILERVQFLRNEYDDLLNRINAERKSIGKDPIQKRQNYITHYQELSAIQDILQMIGMNMTEVPNSMLAISMYTKPNSPYFKYAKRRLGDLSDKDSLQAYLNYIEPALRTIHFSQPIKHGRDILEYKVLIPSEYEAGKVDKVSAFALRYPNAYKYWSTYLNRLTGKRDIMDKLYPGTAALMGATNRLFSAGAIGGNLSTAFTQIASLRNTVAETGLFGLQGAMAMLTPKWYQFYLKNSRIAMGREYEPSTKKNRLFGVKALAKAHDVVSEVASVPIQVLDRQMVGTSFLSGYFKGKKLGLSESDAIRYGDDVAERTQASANVVDRPPVNYGKIKNALGQFQTFIYNEWSQIKNDMVKKAIFGEGSQQGYGDGLGGIKEGKDVGLKRFAGYVAATMILSAMYDAAGLPNPFRSDDSTFPLTKNTAVTKVWQFVVNQVPGISSVRFGGSPILQGGIAGILYLSGNDRQRAASKGKLKSVGVRLFPAGGQLSKTVRGYKYRFEAQGDPWRLIKGLMFGRKYAQPNRAEQQNSNLRPAVSRPVKLRPASSRAVKIRPERTR